MLRKILVLATLAGALALGACNSVTTGGTATPVVTPSQVDSAITTVQQTVVRVCGYLPAVQTVSSILSTFVSSTQPFIAIANTVADGICNAVKNKSTALNRGFAPPSYKGVAIEGKFVR